MVSQGGTLFIYQGQELGLKNFPASWSLEEYKDVATINFWNRSVFPPKIHTSNHPGNPREFFFHILTESYEFDLTFQLNVSRIKERRKAEAKPGEEIDMSDVMQGLQRKARDHSRVPMPVRATRSDIHSHADTELMYDRTCTSFYSVRWDVSPFSGPQIPMPGSPRGLPGCV